jgi:hypothetical protein
LPTTFNVREETGLEIEIIMQENIWIERWNANSFPRPYLCLLEEIPARPDQPTHQHVDLGILGQLLDLIKGYSNRSETKQKIAERIKHFMDSCCSMLKPEDFQQLQNRIDNFLRSTD